ncbi:MAG: PDZ domain-containing protein [Phycisphaerales bacterium]|nr:PDZ domain-containing protein [Phycisphaerales bacterium]
MKRKATTLLSTALLVGVSGLAHAVQSSGNDGFVIESNIHPDHDHDEHVSTSSNSTSTYLVTDNDHSYELKIKNGEYAVKVDGKKIPEDQIKKKGDSVVVYDKDGDVIYKFAIGQYASFAATSPAIPRAPRPIQAIVTDQPGGVGQLTFDVNVSQPPKVMLGIYSDEVGDSLREHLGIKGDAIIVESVIKGLSADKAGIKDNDIIISIDGSDGMSSSGLTKTLKKHAPGDEIQIVVLRKGEKKKLTTKLLAYDAVALGHSSSGNNVWISDDDDRFPTVTGRATVDRLVPQNDFFFAPEVREQTQERIIAKLREKGIEDSIIATIEEDLATTLEGQFWSPRGRDNNQRIFQLQRDHNQAQAEEQRYLAQTMQKKAEQAMREAERMTLEFKDGQLLLKRHAEGLENHIQELEERLHEQMPHIEEEFTDRMAELEDRLEALEDALDERMESLSSLIERLIDRLDQD